MSAASREFSFSDAGRTFTCRVEASRYDAGNAWWWFAVSTEPHQRHAPFRADAEDSAEDVRVRMVAYYDDLIARRNAPWQPHWRRRGAPADAAASVGPAVAPIVAQDGDLPAAAASTIATTVALGVTTAADA